MKSSDFKGVFISNPQKPMFTDQLNRTIVLKGIPERIISLVPSQTELLVDLGLGDRIVGLTKFCVHPKNFKRTKTIIGGTKNFHFDKIDGLKPDLIIGNKEENYQEGIDALADKYPVWMSDIANLEDAFAMMRGIGEITGTLSNAEKLVAEIQNDFTFKIPHRGSVLYFIWKDPLMVAGKGTFIDDMLTKAGFQNLMEVSRYPVVGLEEVRSLKPDFLFLSSEPFPFKEKHIAEFKKSIPTAQVFIVDGEIFSWYGSRLKHAAGYFKKMLADF
ncbi:hypothetical protein P872_24170 [Rhodonellum psychrophilum GCM71 = DSM 17998]|uniref:Fe/B12 periplasmic-binding domain-containing protein n=3 Tax=Rhodonellum TaxID=336827 RepID=U5C442_9BACT|nr:MULTISPECIES: helical backbone metal receptor [Rhodonellum]ERM84808.1 hypothetical protein P872_24170 [Rhodonellum psychrophilum GCM71 = DSM 17998]SDZ10901.1 ABC-type Fe3+-hydroxamate transport system, substrate-binding protein [Rhodonellum ikkaensis]